MVRTVVVGVIFVYLFVLVLCKSCTFLIFFIDCEVQIVQTIVVFYFSSEFEQVIIDVHGYQVYLLVDTFKLTYFVICCRV